LFLGRRRRGNGGAGGAAERLALAVDTAWLAAVKFSWLEWTAARIVREEDILQPLASARTQKKKSVRERSETALLTVVVAGALAVCSK
jgi:hypothetical protein